MARTVLCGANSYLQKYYFNNEFDKLPDIVKKELQIACVTFTEEVGGIIILQFNEAGKLEISVQADEKDFLFDEIGSELKIKEMQKDKKDLFEGIETYYKAIRTINGE
ncbi:MAG: hypothetical protein E7242_06380 [Lachnospiraceae bacterium]|nr:hypothetical protein [Lachnospiraceae bacterium]